MSEVRRHDEIQGEIIHEYDGIEEADNRLPNWWLATFYGAIAFSVVYWFAFHEFGALELPLAKYTAELERRAAEGGGPVSEQLLVALKDDPDALAEGQATFVSNCAACHEANGGGKIGPNLTDAFWLHGGAPTDMYAIVHDGVLEKGMPAWGPSLGAPTVQRVVAYLLTLQNTEVAGGKGPEGERWPPGAEEAPAAAGGEGAEGGDTEGAPPAEAPAEAPAQAAPGTPEAQATAGVAVATR